MVEVGVGEQYRVERLGVKRSGLPIALSQFLEALKQTAIDEDARAACFE